MHRFNVVAAALLVATLAAAVAPGSTEAAPRRCYGKRATVSGVTGTEGNDVIVGTDGPDIIDGRGGNDLICARDGDDDVDAGPGNDTVHGGDGDDWLHTFDATAPDNDTYYGERGEDEIEDNVGANVAKGGTERDIIDVTGKAYGGSHDDYFVAATETSPGAHDGYANGGSSDEAGGFFCPPKQICGKGFEFVGGVVVNGGTADGGSGDDWVTGTQTGDKVYGGSGVDYLNTANGTVQSVIDCGSGYDSYFSDANEEQNVRRCEQVAD